MTASAPSPHPELDDLATELFGFIARCEYALKASGYLMHAEGKAQPNWDRFAGEIGEALLAIEDSELQLAHSYLLEHPPKKQIVHEGMLDWEESKESNQPKGQRLFGHIRQVRNNLFHGGKFNGRWFEPQRSKELIESSLIVLRRAVELEPTVFCAFNE